jgi:two-component system, OmpR family, sensor histidine kinase KdpD
MKFLRVHIIPIILRHLAALLTVWGTTILLRQLYAVLSIQIVVIIYLLPVIISTSLWGLTPGALAGFAAFLAFNYYFIPPYFQFTVHRTQDLITLVLFLIVAVVISQMIGQARDGIRLAKSREWEATHMYELIAALAGVQDNPSIARTIGEHTLATFLARQVEISIEKQKEGAAFTIRLPENTPPVHGKPSARIAMMTVRSLEGEIRIWYDRPFLSGGEQKLAETFASQGALAIERTRLSRTENRARLLEESDRMKSSLLSSVSHELRSPLATIKASVSSLRGGAVDWESAAREDLLAVIEEETDHLNYLVGNLLDMSRIESGALKPKREWNMISEILGGVLKKMSKITDKHQLVLDIPANLPLIPTDYVQMEQVFSNLLSNSIKYAPQVSTITISAHTQNDGVLRVSVRNQGPSVPEEYLERIFDKFFRITAADRITGTGLGLSICKGIIEAHGGKIWAENTADGLAFIFTLPLTLDGELPHMPEDIKDE